MEASPSGIPLPFVGNEDGSKYRYLPLNGERSEIRLLYFKDVHNGSGSSTKSLLIPRISLFQVSLDEKPSFRALSYFWGRDRSGKVECDGQQLSVTQNVCKALRKLRKFAADIADSEALFWIDAICIDQKNIVERNSQVKLMGKIYSQASVVLVYLGDPAETGREHNLLELANPNESKGPTKLDVHEISPISSPEDSSQVEHSEIPDGPAWAALEEMLCQPWFCRTWTLQETVLAQSVLCMYGEVLFDPEDLVACISARAQRRSLQLFGTRFEGSDAYAFGSPKTAKQIGSINANNFVSAWQIRGRWHRGEVLDSIELLQNNRHRQCDNKKDKIYAFLSLMSDVERALFEPDYSVANSAMKLFSSFAAHNVRSGQALKLLHYANSMENLSNDLPSWAPDWSLQFLAQPLSFTLYHCATRVEPDIRLSADEKTIFVRGFILDEIRSHRGQILPQGEYYDYEDQGLNPDHVIELIDNKIVAMGSGKFQQFAEVSACYGGDQAAKDAIYRALVANTDGKGGLDTVENRREYDVFLDTYTRRSASDDFYLRWITEGYSAELIDRCHYGFLERFLTIQAYRCIAVTIGGRVGSIPCDFEHGDQIAIIFGAPVPYLLRPLQLNGQYILVGPCYIDGLMENDLFDDTGSLKDPDGLVIRDLELSSNIITPPNNQSEFFVNGKPLQSLSLADLDAFSTIDSLVM